MKCQKCKTEMVLRSGKFGQFYACSKSNPTDNHGTISLSVSGQTRYNSIYHNDLDTEIQRQMMPYIGRMTDLDLFVEGIPEDDDDEHWMNTRPY
ncbi:Topoisomerase DNA binding C4 zinc finger [compost metagenome]